jgi:hydrogenase nickel incorporation protein HypA/HybF
MSLIMDLWKVVQSESKLHQYTLINTINIEVGDYLKVIDEFLLSAFDALKMEHPLIKNTKLTITSKHSVAKCMSCNTEWSFEESPYICPDCADSNMSIIDGHELKIVSMDVEIDTNTS